VYLQGAHEGTAKPVPGFLCGYEGYFGIASHSNLIARQYPCRRFKGRQQVEIYPESFWPLGPAARAAISLSTTSRICDITSHATAYRATLQQIGKGLMAKGYWVASVDITDPEGYKAYVSANAEAFRKFGAKFLVRGGNAECVEGRTRSRLVVLQFSDFAAALACYRSPEYESARKLRVGKSEADLVIVEGYDGMQP
jgi:uncharacterized protein (DUF1330 family)